MTLSIMGTPRFDMLRSLHLNSGAGAVASPLNPPVPALFFGKVAPDDSFQKGVNARASYPQAKTMPKLGAPLTLAALQQRQLEGPLAFMGRQAANPLNPFKLAATDNTHPAFAGHKNPALPTINYFNLKGNQRKIEPPVKSSAPSSAVILAIAGLSMLTAQVLAPAITLLKSGPLLSAVSQWNPLSAIKTYLQVLIPRT
jgi:hypothetical protein